MYLTKKVLLFERYYEKLGRLAADSEKVFGKHIYDSDGHFQFN